MGVFSYGSEAMDYYTTFCRLCLHSKSECVVWTLHKEHSVDDDWAVFLDELIPRKEVGGKYRTIENGRCVMMVAIPAQDVDWDDIMAQYLKDVITLADSEEFVVLRESREPKPVPCERGRL